MARVDYWNHNVHYQPVILRAVPPGCGAALEVGCGDGLLASRLAERCAEVTAIDRDARMIALARSRAQTAGPGRMTVVEADYLAYPLADAASTSRARPPRVWRVMRRLAARAGLPDDLTGRVGPETMRHSFATLYLDAGGSLSDLQEVMGHADPRTTRRYDRERQARRQSPGDLVAAYLSTPPRQRM